MVGGDCVNRDTDVLPRKSRKQELIADRFLPISDKIRACEAWEECIYTGWKGHNILSVNKATDLPD